MKRKYQSVTDANATDAGPETDFVSHLRGPGRRPSAQFGANKKLDAAFQVPRLFSWFFRLPDS